VEGKGYINFINLPECSDTKDTFPELKNRGKMSVFFLPGTGFFYIRTGDNHAMRSGKTVQPILLPENPLKTWISAFFMDQTWLAPVKWTGK
jgi:hypothetical protein